MARCRLIIASLLALASSTFAQIEAQDAKRAEANTSASLTALAARVRKSVMVITHTSRDGKETGLGTGFVISADGLIATNMHVIGEGRPIGVQAADGTTYEVTAIHAAEPSADLAIIRVKADSLTPLELGDSSKLEQGERVVAVGNPLGYRHSVVEGIISGRREFDKVPMFQLAIPIERGNSGGPLLDLEGRVFGILTLKSAVEQSVGFAVEINALKPLIENPNPVSMSQWLTIGALNSDDWTPLFGARWRQRAGRIVVDGFGEGFGGRSLALSRAAIPEVPFEVAVSVKMSQLDGAAGLVFHCDGSDKHYGFYPSSGQMRLSRFDGPNVNEWNVLQESRSPHYRPHEWNDLKVRVEATGIQCFVNDELVFKSSDAIYTSGQVGLAKFRHTDAEFKNFRVGKELPRSRPEVAASQKILDTVLEIGLDRPPQDELIGQFIEQPDVSAVVLQEQARKLEKQAQRYRELAEGVHQESVRRELGEMFRKPEEEIDLLSAALLIARLDNNEVTVAAYLKEADEMVAAIKKSIPADADAETRLAALNKHMFEEMGFHGSRSEYYHRSNSYLNEVMDDREGLPITLSVLYMELAKRLALKVVGVGLPGHFIVRYEPAEGEPRLIDPFERGKQVSREDAILKVEANTGEKFREDYFAAQSKKQITLRMLSNLMGIAREQADAEAMLRYVSTVIAIDPESAEYHRLRAILRYNTDRIDEALEDTDWLINRKPAGIDVDEMLQLRSILETRAKQQ